MLLTIQRCHLLQTINPWREECTCKIHLKAQFYEISCFSRSIATARVFDSRVVLLKVGQLDVHIRLSV